MKSAIYSCLLASLLVGSGTVLAVGDMPSMNHADMQNMKQSASTLQGHKAEGVVNSINMQNDTINLTHGPVKSLEWPGMTMDFKVKNMAILKGINPGQKVKFEIIKERAGEFYVSRITPLK